MAIFGVLFFALIGFCGFTVLLSSNARVLQIHSLSRLSLHGLPVYLPLLLIQLHVRSMQSAQVQSTVFCVRCGTARGIITHCFRSETSRDMATWARALVQGSHNAINYQREFNFRCIYQVNKWNLCR